jgi:hypothetical protein
MMKSFLATAGLSLVMLAMPVGLSGNGVPAGLIGPSPALADVDIDVDINLELKKFGKISCRRGERIVERAGSAACSHAIAAAAAMSIPAGSTAIVF